MRLITVSKPSIFLIAITTFLLCSCGGMRVNYDYDSKTNFSNYTTYNYQPEMASGLSEFDERRLLHAMDSVLQARGFQFSEEPELLINIYSQAYTEPSRSNVGIGVGGTGRTVGGGVSIGVPVGRETIQREFYIDFVDEKTQELFWQALVATKFNPMAKAEAREEFFKELVAKVLEGYPPQ